MAKFDRGVSYYTIADLSMQISFPEDEVKCKWCKFLKHYDGMNRDKCGLTDDILYSTELRGLNCPLVIINSINTEELK
jgi:hypothetical protein